MYSKQHRTAKTGSDSHDTPASNQFAPRPFVVQAQTEEVKAQQDKTDDLQTKAEKSKEFSDGFPEPAVFTRHLTPPSGKPWGVPIALPNALYKDLYQLSKQGDKSVTVSPLVPDRKENRDLRHE